MIDFIMTCYACMSLYIFPIHLPLTAISHTTCSISPPKILNTFFSYAYTPHQFPYCPGSLF